MSRFEEVSRKKIKRIAWKFTKAVILLGLAGYELIITNSAYGLVGYTCCSSIFTLEQFAFELGQNSLNWYKIVWTGTILIVLV